MTYLPKHFEETDPATLHALVHEFPLATWVVPHQGELLVNHIPFLLDTDRGENGTLIGHVARANPVWKSLGRGKDGGDTNDGGAGMGVAVFNGPQAYISPNWYPSKHENGKAVPTWNYTVVHAHGHARVVDDPQRLLQLLHRLTDQHESTQAQPWKVSDAPPQYLEAMLKAIVYIEIPVQRWVGKWKISQNQTAENRHGAANGLGRNPVAPSPSQAMADLVRQGSPSKRL